MQSVLGAAPRKGLSRRRKVALQGRPLGTVHVGEVPAKGSVGVEFQNSDSISQNGNSISKDHKTSQELDRALEVAVNNLKSLKTAEEMSEQLVIEVKQEEEQTTSVIDTTFTNFIAALNSRKRKLQTELGMNVSNYIRDVHKVQSSIVEKKSSLDEAIKIAREWKAKPTFKNCHSLSQVLRNLKLSVEDEISKLENMKTATIPRFYLDGEKSTSVFENIGKIHLHEADLYDCLSRRKTNQDPLLEENHVKICVEECDVQLGGTSAPIQQMAQLSTETACAPDVIIEEIIDDDPESSQGSELVMAPCDVAKTWTLVVDKVPAWVGHRR
uniref:Uncharacterized protein n=1 Tax=Sphaerodactylus townsendi TaxID=933632 RepID=A0ACB8FFX6_9SAUR